MKCSCSALLALFLFFLCLLLKALHVLWLKPKGAERLFWRQGLRGPPYRFFTGNLCEMVSMMLQASSNPISPPLSHNILPRTLSFYHHWKKAYGRTFVLWFGPTARLVIGEPDLIREMMVSRAAAFDRYVAHPFIRQLEGEGLINLRGAKWAHHRKLISPVFHVDNLRRLMPAMGEKMNRILEKLSAAAAASGEVEIDVADWYQGLTEEAINRATFGRSFDQASAVLKLQAKLMLFAAEVFNRNFIPGYRFLPTVENRKRWKLEREIRERLERLVSVGREKKKEEEAADSKDLIGQMTGIPIQDIVEECKTFFFAGKQTTTNLLTWATLLLAMHPEWQRLARDELARVCGSCDVPSKDDLPNLKMLEMIVKETLRLYPPVVATIRRASLDVELGRYVVPQGTEILVPIVAVHHDPELWGPDADLFNPSRFAEGASRPSAFMPFGLGRRMCVGRGLAVLEAKMALAAVLRRFEIRISPNYVHAPTVLMMLHPQYGAPVIFRPIPVTR